VKLEELNALPNAAAEAELLRCCGSSRWAKIMAEARPFDRIEQLYGEAEKTWWNLRPADWLEAFRAHPKIGERRPEAAWSGQEQAGMSDATPAVVDAVARANQDYFSRFGYIFIVCATGKTAAEMLSRLESRLLNNADQELQVAAAEQNKITRLRLEKLIAA